MKHFEITDDAAYAQAVAYCIKRAAGADSSASFSEKLDATKAIVDAVRERGDAAVAEFTERFDHVTLKPAQFELTNEDVDAALQQVDRSLVAALERAHDNIRRFHEKTMAPSWEETTEDGTMMGRRLTPIESVGLYCPGQTAFYPSSVLMNLVPAKVAGVENIVVVSPPSFNGVLHPLVVAAARLAGATRIFRVGGAQAVAALAFGTETVPQVTKITGPGNIYVTLAKRLISTVCDIDKEAGPSEVVVIADDKADPKLVAIELICQAEHDEDAVTTLITTSGAQAEAVQRAIDLLLPTLSRADIARKAMENHGAAFVVRDLDEGVRLTNVIAPEHLSIQVEVPIRVFDKVRHAGAIMIGALTPVAVCDYYAGPNHILPTGRRARFASPLTVEDFRKVTNYVSYSRDRLRREADDIIRLAEAEGLTAHARAVEFRR